MAKTIPATLLKAMEWGGRSYPPGATVALPVLDALTLKRRRLVSLTAKARPPAPAPPDPVPAETARRRRYRRRDLQAEDTPVGSDAAVGTIDAPPPAAEAAPTPDEDT